MTTTKLDPVTLIFESNYTKLVTNCEGNVLRSNKLAFTFPHTDLKFHPHMDHHPFQLDTWNVKPKVQFQMMRRTVDTEYNPTELIHPPRTLYLQHTMSTAKDLTENIFSTALRTNQFSSRRYTRFLPSPNDRI